MATRWIDQANREVSYAAQGMARVYEPSPDELREVLPWLNEQAAQDARPARPAPTRRAPSPTKAPPTTTRAPYTPPRDPGEAERRFYAKYGHVFGARNWGAVQDWLGYTLRWPRTVEEWQAVAATVRDTMREATRA